jgi:threonine dehydrogenase-like Zn-dependent dehydrogenase
LVPGTTTLHLVDRPERVITSPDEVKIKVLQVGICGTDREEASGGRAEAPPGKTELVSGINTGFTLLTHWMFLPYTREFKRWRARVTGSTE